MRTARRPSGERIAETVDNVDVLVPVEFFDGDGNSHGIDLLMRECTISRLTQSYLHSQTNLNKLKSPEKPCGSGLAERFARKNRLKS